MDTVDPQIIRSADRALQAAWRRWEQDPRELSALRQQLRDTQALLASVENAGTYQGQEMRLLVNQARGIEACISQRHKEQARGY